MRLDGVATIGKMMATLQRRPPDAARGVLVVDVEDAGLPVVAGGKDMIRIGQRAGGRED